MRLATSCSAGQMYASSDNWAEQKQSSLGLESPVIKYRGEHYTTTDLDTRLCPRGASSLARSTGNSSSQGVPAFYHSSLVSAKLSSRVLAVPGEDLCVFATSRG